MRPWSHTKDARSHFFLTHCFPTDDTLKGVTTIAKFYNPEINTALPHRGQRSTTSDQARQNYAGCAITTLCLTV